MAQQTGSQQETVADALARRVEARRGLAARGAGAFRELGAGDRAVYEAVARTPTAELDGPVRRLSDAANYSRLWLGGPAPTPPGGGGRGGPGAGGGRRPAVGRAQLLARVAGHRRHDRAGWRRAGAPGGAGGRGRDRRDLGDRQPRREAPCPGGASGPAPTRAVPGPPGPDAGIDLVPLWACRVGVRVRLRRRPAPAGAGPADPAPCGWGGLLAGPSRRALPGRRGARRHPRSRNRSHGGSGIRPPPLATGATAHPPAG